MPCDVFISYRREHGAEVARLIGSELQHRNIEVFLDVDDLRTGHFDEALLGQIEASGNFLVILTPQCLDRCRDSEDWFRREIAHAIKHQKNVIPLIMPGFRFPASEEIPEDLRPLRVHHGVSYSHEFFAAMMTKIVGYLGGVQPIQGENDNLTEDDSAQPVVESDAGEPTERAVTPEPPPQTATSYPLRNWLVIAGLAALFLFGVVLYLMPASGTVKIELSDPQAKVEVEVDGKTIHTTGLDRPLRLPAGEHHLVVAGQDFKTVRHTFRVRRGMEDLLPVELVRNPVKPVTNSIGMKLVLVPQGEFLMGASHDEEDAQPEERPQHSVRITKPFYLGVYEVTQGEFEQVMETNPSFFQAEGEGASQVAGQETLRFPVENVSWDEAVEFCRRLSDRLDEKSARRVYRLPTEAEWEYACRGGTTTPFSFGDQLDGREANCNGNEPYGTSVKGPALRRTRTVGEYAANAFGLYDMHGNVWEWCATEYGPYAAETTVVPAVTTSMSYRVYRGGSWRINAGQCRSAHRRGSTPDYRLTGLGFRVLSEISTPGDGNDGPPALKPDEPGLPDDFRKLVDLHTPLKEPTQDESYLDYINGQPPLPAESEKVYLQPLGEFSQAQLEIIELTADFLRKSCDLEVVICEQSALLQLPADARRGQKSTEQISTKYLMYDYLPPNVPEDAAFYIAITTSDLWPGEDGFNFVLGHHFPSKRVGVWSIQRYGDPSETDESRRTCLLRTAKMGSWIVCHLLALETCGSYKCTLNDMVSVAELDDMPLWLCPRCLAKLCWATKPDLEQRFDDLTEFCKSQGLNDELRFYEKSRALIGER